MKKNLFFFLLLLYTFSFGQIFTEKHFSNSDKWLIETIFSEYNKTPDSAKEDFRLAKFFAEQSPSNNATKNIIANVFLAKKISEQSDSLNSESTRFFEKALAESKKIKRTDLEIWTSLHYAFYLYSYRKYESCFPYFMICIKNMDQTKDENIIQIRETYQKVAYFLCTSGENGKAIEYFEKAKQYAKNNQEKAALEYNIGQCYFNLNLLGTAEKYFVSSKKISQACNEKIRYAKSIGSLGEIALKKGKTKDAISLLQQDIEISETEKSDQNTMYALIVLGNAYLAENNLADAEKALEKAQQYALSKNYYKSSEEDINTLILKIAKIKGDDKAELQARRNLEALSLSLNSMDGKKVIEKVGLESQKDQLQFLLENEKGKREKESYQKKAAIGGIFLLLGLFIFIIRSYRHKIKAEKSQYENKVLTLLLEKTKSENKLNTTTITLNSYREYLQEKNQQIEKLQSEMQKIKKSAFSSFERKSGNLQKLLESHLMTEDNWNTFKNAFIQEYPKYCEYLFLNFPDLTDSNLRIIILTKLEISNTEISRIAGVTLDAVKKAKQRLRKKYEDRYDELFEMHN